jgi:predicted enzyme related to lactoylglutathione lyase
MPDKTARGRFVWHELMAPDTAKAHEFYGKVVGWKMQPFEADPSYQMFAASSGPIGGTVAQSGEASHWLPYLGTIDIEATIKQAQGLGATVVTDISSTPNGGRWARLTDPQGASFAVYQSTGKPGREKPPKRGEFSWHELMTTDYPAAFKFYSAVFGWEKVDEVDMGEGLGMYFMFGRNGVPLGGMFNLMPQMEAAPAWTGYIRVKDLNKAVKKAKAGGATLISGPMEVPGGDWIAQFIDPQGAMFAVHVLKADLAPAASTEATSPAPEQGTLDFPPASAGAPEKVAVVAKKPAANASRSQSTASGSKGAAKPAARKAGSKPAAKKAAKPIAKKRGAKQAAKKVAKKAAKKKAPARKAAKKKSVVAKRSAKSARKAPAAKAKKKARRAK